MEMLMEKLMHVSSADGNPLSPMGHKKNHPRRRHRHATVLADRILADEVFTCCENSDCCDIGIAIPPCSVLTGTVTVTVLECMPVLCGPKQPIQVNITLLIQKELKITEPNGRTIPLEFTFHKKCCQTFSLAKLDGIDPKRIRCIVSAIPKVCPRFNLICRNKDFDGHATIAEELEVFLEIKLVVSEPLKIKLRHRRNKAVVHKP